MVRQRRSNSATGKTKERLNLRPATNPEEGASPNEAGTSNTKADKHPNKRAKLTGSPEIIGSQTVTDEGVNKIESSHIATRSSTRQVKKIKRDESCSTPLTKGKDSKTSNTPDGAKALPAKSRRPWELWTANDKKLFFEGLFQYGKDFDAIQDFIQKKVGRKTDPHLIKNKDQVRYFYYRTWNKIQKFVDIDNKVEKSTQELYGLINFGELRKRVGPGLKLDQKTGQKFRELVHNGLTTIKFRGKNYRLRTPVCRALKVLNKLSEGEKEQRLSLPESLFVELQPKNNEAWSRVQSCSHNPHVKMTIKPSRQLASIFSFLDKKWKTADEKLRDKLQVVVKTETELRLSVPQNNKVYPVTFKTAEAQPRLGVTLENYKENFKTVTDSPTQKVNAVTTEHPLEGSRVRCDSNKQYDSPDIDYDGDCDEVASTNVLGEKREISRLISEEASNVSSTKSSPTAKEPDLNKESSNAGWTAKSVKTLTVGEVYLMLGRPKTVVLEYEWCDIQVDRFQLLTLNNMLRRLVHLASSQLMDVSRKPNSSPARCTCKCGKASTPSTTKSPANSRSSPAVNKDPTTPRGRRLQPSPVATKPSVGDAVFVAPATVPPKAPPSPKAGEPIKPLDGTHFLQQFDSLKPQKHKMRNRMNRRPFLVQRRLLPKAQTVAVPMFSGTPVNTIRSTIVPVLPGRSSPSITSTGVTRTVISQSAVMSMNTVTPNLVSQVDDITNIISAAASQCGIQTGHTPPRGMGVTVTSPAGSSMTTINAAAPPAKKPRRITPIPVFEDANHSPLSNPTSPFASISAQQMSSPLAGTSLGNPSPVPPPMEMQVSDVLHQLASQVDADLSSSTATLTTDSVKPSPIEPPSITSFLDLSLPATDMSESNDKFIDSFCGLLDSSGIIKSSSAPTQTTSSEINATLPASPNRSPVKISSPVQLSSWFNNDDFSLSSFLMDSPQKKTSDLPPSTAPSHAIQFTDVDTHFQNMLNENSVDLASKFADIAAQMAASKD